jgi:hypothetical protein
VIVDLPAHLQGESTAETSVAPPALRVASAHRANGIAGDAGLSPPRACFVDCDTRRSVLP